MDWGDVVFIVLGLMASLLTLMHPMVVVVVVMLGSMVFALVHQWGKI